MVTTGAYDVRGCHRAAKTPKASLVFMGYFLSPLITVGHVRPIAGFQRCAITRCFDAGPLSEPFYCGDDIAASSPSDSSASCLTPAPNGHVLDQNVYISLAVRFCANSAAMCFSASGLVLLARAVWKLDSYRFLAAALWSYQCVPSSLHPESPSRQQPLSQQLPGRAAAWHNPSLSVAANGGFRCRVVQRRWLITCRRHQRRGGVRALVCCFENTAGRSVFVDFSNYGNFNFQQLSRPDKGKLTGDKSSAVLSNSGAPTGIFLFNAQAFL